MTYYLGMDIGGTNTRLLTMDQKDKWVKRDTKATPYWSETGDPLASLAAIITEHMHALTEKPAGIMLGLPGTLNQQRDTFCSLPFIPELNNRKVASDISRLIQIPAAMDKDVNHLHLCDLSTLTYIPQVSVGIYIGTGIGNSIWIKDKFYRGANGASGEIGHIPWPDSQNICPCGKSSCVESITSGYWLSRWAEKNIAASDSITAIFTHYQNHKDIRQFIDRLAMLIASEINILDPEQLFLGGGVIGMKGFPKQELEQSIRKHLRALYPAKNLRITFSLQTGNTACQGACLAAKRQFYYREKLP